MSADLVAYSGFSAANYIQEPYSADLDFGTGEWSCSAWVNTLNTAPPDANVCTAPLVGVIPGWNAQPPSGYVTVTTNAVAAPDTTITATRIVVTGATGGAYYANSSRFPARMPITISFDARGVNGGEKIGLGTNVQYQVHTLTNQWATYSVSLPASSNNGVLFIGLGPTYVGQADAEIHIANIMVAQSNTAQPFVNATYAGSARIADRAHSSGPAIFVGIDRTGTLTATANDGTTTRTVTTTAAYNTATWLKVRANYTTDGRLAILVNGVEVASATGTALLTLNNSNAVLTIGNSYALDAPFPGSLALLKFSATVPTAEQSQWMYEQEKHLFSVGAKCVLPASTNVLDLAYDDATDTWSTLQATHESTFSGLVRTSTQTPSAGSFSKTAETSGVQLLGRTTTNPGVDVRMPVKNLRAKDMPRDTNQDIVVFDFDAVTSQTDFVLPVGYTARVVYSAGAQKRLGSTKDYTVLFDGFRETVRFGTAPGNGVWVQIHAVKEVVL